MTEQLEVLLQAFRRRVRQGDLDEAATKQSIVLPLLQCLGWPVFDIDEVKPEYSVEGRRVDYSLRLQRENRVFLEVKKAEEDLGKHQEQLLDYSFRQGVRLAVLTNGTTWWFYMPLLEGSWEQRKFYTIDIAQQECRDAAQTFINLLSKEGVQSGSALQIAESIYKGKLKGKALVQALPEAWNKVIGEPDSLLVDLLSETTERICGFKPDVNEVTKFLKERVPPNPVFVRSRDVALLAERSHQEASQPPTPRGKKNTRGMKNIREELIPFIIKVLQAHGGRARKKQVEAEIYEMRKDVFKEPWYQERVSSNVPRWEHNIAWARDGAKRQGLIKPPEDSGYGYWELTEKGMKWSGGDA